MVKDIFNNDTDSLVPTVQDNILEPFYFDRIIRRMLTNQGETLIISQSQCTRSKNNALTAERANQVHNLLSALHSQSLQRNEIK